jgi:hypothetical protein
MVSFTSMTFATSLVPPHLHPRPFLVLSQHYRQRKVVPLALLAKSSSVRIDSTLNSWPSPRYVSHFIQCDDTDSIQQHRSVVHVVDARTFEEVQIISVPFGSPERPRPRASTSRRRTPHPTSFGTIPVAPASSSFEPLHPLPVDLHSEIAQVRAQLRRQDLQILADDMIAYFAPPGPPAVLDPSGAEEEEDCPPDSEPTRPVRSIPTRLPTARGTGSISRIAPASVLRSYGYPSQLLPPTLSGYAPLSALITSYQSNSAYFPQEANDPTDLLGLDWDEWGDKLFVATEKNVWEWDVDSRGRQCFGEYRVR